MLRSFKLLLPALIPSWRFFDAIAPSPRIEFALLASDDDAVHWHEFSPRPARLSFVMMLRRLFWNPQGNDALFLVSCAERMVDQPTAHSQQEILTHITAAARGVPDAGAAAYLQFRLVFVSRQDTELRREILFVSPLYPYHDQNAAA